nr:immunoglobulin heavy chain junction region [Macaca mulatta]MOV38217.1 immunoglobulin heavy chain junction region [Macaca mulatta]MOV38260.1 immunoglobulin heavy chain junction region [Macaca mulatta]MOV38382.1 immunoglobulin heavy chain junction region [Macaca mulatta]MOV38395.1 immunoglobulin heavy chain junction region [Macaca mulatta]
CARGWGNYEVRFDVW